jgi:hypothetical protein
MDTGHFVHYSGHDQENGHDQNTRHSPVQYPSESRITSGFWIRSYASPDHSIARPFDTGHKSPGFEWWLA